jgi:hypothetical protein
MDQHAGHIWIQLDLRKQVMNHFLISKRKHIYELFPGTTQVRTIPRLDLLPLLSSLPKRRAITHASTVSKVKFRVKKNYIQNFVVKSRIADKLDEETPAPLGF